MLALTLAAILSPGAPVPPPRSRPVYDYAAMTPEQAQQLAGRTIRLKANIVDSHPEYAENANGDDNLRGIDWRRGDDTVDEGEMLLEGRLTVRYIPSYFIEGQWVEGFFRLRL